MIKKWLVTYQRDYCDNVWLSIIVEANTEYGAINKAQKHLEKEEARPFWIVNCEEVSNWDVSFWDVIK